MFYYIEGRLTYLDLTFAVIDVNGLGYKLTITQTTHAAISPRLGSSELPTRLYTYMAVREDDVELFGFSDENELNMFKLLITVSGVGPKAAISVLSVFSPEKFSMAVCGEDTKGISKANGIGAKTAARIVLELKDKISKSFAAGVPSQNGGDISYVESSAESSVLSDAQSALMVLGYTRSEIIAALRGADITDKSTNDIIKLALKRLSKQ